MVSPNLAWALVFFGIGAVLLRWPMLGHSVSGRSWRTHPEKAAEKQRVSSVAFALVSIALGLYFLSRELPPL